MLLRYTFIVICLSFLFGCSQSETNSFAEIELEINTFITLMEYDLETLEKEIIKLGDTVQYLYANKDEILLNADRSKYSFDRGLANSLPNEDPNLSTIYISELLKSQKEWQDAKELVYLTNSLDEIFKNIIKKYDVVSQVYFNSDLQVNRLFPPYDARTMLEPNLDLTSFNFYYYADSLNNPERKPVWVDEIYIDPVGRGWMISLLNPVYEDGELKMVLAFDVTLNDIIETYLDKFDRYFIIVDETGTLVAGKTKGIEALSFPPLKNHAYNQTITSDSFRMEDFNLFRSKSSEVRKMASKIILSSEKEYVLKEGEVDVKICAKRMEKLDWYVLDIMF